MRYLLSFDCGKSSGVTLWEYGEDQPANRIGAWQFGGGAEGLRDWIDEHYNGDTWDARVELDREPTWRFGEYASDDVEANLFRYVVEKFTPLQGKGFSLTLDSVEPLVGEGVLIANRLAPAYRNGVVQDCWQRPAEMYFCGGSTKVEKLKRSRAWLKDHGLLLTGKDVGCPDADDAISSTLHALAWFRKMKHKTTLEFYWGGEPKDPQPV